MNNILQIVNNNIPQNVRVNIGKKITFGCSQNLTFTNPINLFICKKCGEVECKMHIKCDGNGCNKCLIQKNIGEPIMGLPICGICGNLIGKKFGTTNFIIQNILDEKLDYWNVCPLCYHGEVEQFFFQFWF